MRNSLPVLDDISIPVHCPVSWEGMSGDERARFCPTCSQTVHNLSAMTREEAAALVAAEGASACVRFYRRPDGTLVTRDCHDSRTGRRGWGLRRLIWACAS